MNLDEFVPWMCGGETASSEPEQNQPALHHQWGTVGELGWEEGSAASPRHPPGVPGWKPSREIAITLGASLQPYSAVWKAI